MRQDRSVPESFRQQLMALQHQLSHYQRLFASMTEGFGVGEVVLDAAGHPVDIRLVETNAAFHRQTGLSRDIIGRPASTCLPRIERSWIERFGEVALSGEPLRFESHNADTDRYYEVFCYSPERGCFAVLFQDISERLRMEAALRESEQRYAALFDNELNAICHCRIITDDKGVPVDYLHLRVNRALEAIVGLRREEIEGRRSTELWPGIEKQEPNLIDTCGDVALHGGAREFEFFLARTGQWFNIYLYSHSPGDFTLIFSDISPRKQAELALQASEAELRATVEQAGVGIIHISAEFIYFRVNRKFCDMVGYSPEELSSMTVFDLTYAPDRDVGVADLRRALRGESSGYIVEKRYVHRSGRVIWVRITGAPVCHPRTGDRYSLCIVEDITERKQAEAEVEGFFRQAAVGVLVLDIKGHVRRANTYVCRLLGYDETELLRLSFEELCHADDLQANLDLFGRLRSGEIPLYTLEKRFRHKNGHFVWGISSVVLGGTEPGSQPHVVDVLTDISARKQLEQDLRHAQVELESRVEQRTAALRQASRAAEASRREAEAALVEAEAANRAKTDFLATMSHEIRTPLNGVIGFCGLLLDGPLTESKRHYAELARQSGESLLHLLNDFLDFSKIEAGRLELEPVEFDLPLEIGQVLALVQPAAREKGLVLDSHVAVPHRLRGDAARLRQVLLNLLSNAVKFTAQGRVRLSCCEAAREGRSVRIGFEVTDTGIGIDAELRSRLFRPFVQGHSITRRYGGTGLGLAICKRLVTAMGGEIGCRSRMGEGSTFWFELPLELLPEEDQPLPEAGLDVLGPDAATVSRGRVLVAEDNSVSQLLAAEVLKRLGCQVDVVGDGEEAVEAYRRLPYDMILMDCDMPVMDGFAATREIRRLEASDESFRNRHVPIIAMTASALQGDPERCLAAGMDEFMSKPLRLVQLRQVVEAWLSPRHRGEAPR